MRAAIYPLVSLLLPGLIFAAELPLPEYKNIGAGAWYGVVRSVSPALVYHVIKVAPKKDGLELRPIRPRGGQDLGDLAADWGSEEFSLLGAITGDYFSYLKENQAVIPWGILVQEGKLLFSPAGKSALCSGGEGFYISVPEMDARVRNRLDSPGVRVASVNRPLEAAGGAPGIFNSTWGPFAPEIPAGFAVTVSGVADFSLQTPAAGEVAGINRLPVKVPIPEDGFVLIIEKLPPPEQLDLKLGSPVLADIAISGSPRSAIGGGPRIVRSGEISVELERENFGPGTAFYIKNSRHPRSAVGIGPPGGFIYLVVVEGRSETSRGMTLPELAGLLRSLGAAEAMAFDGGRSVAMLVAGRTVVEGDRRLADALGVLQVKK